MVNKKLWVILGVVLLSACGVYVPNNAWAEETREEMIERVLNLPPEPSANEVDATILGVDVNNNNIRDEVERKIAFDLYEDPKSMKLQMRRAQIWSEDFEADGDVSKLRLLTTEAYMISSCYTLGIEDYASLLEAIDSKPDYYSSLSNTKERIIGHSEASRVHGAKIPTDEESVAYCSQYE